jgi:hypothetical protein
MRAQIIPSDVQFSMIVPCPVDEASGSFALGRVAASDDVPVDHAGPSVIQIALNEQ